MDLNKLVVSYKKRIHMSEWPDDILFQDIDFINGLCYYIKYHLKNRYYYYKNNRGE